MEYVKIPLKRIGALIGKSGETKAHIEKTAHVRVIINSETGEVTISENKRDPLMTWVARDIVNAIGKGFAPKKAFLLFDDDYYLHVIDIVTERRGDEKRIKSRIIGTEGKTREYIERTTKTYLSIADDCVCIIGTQDGIGIAKSAIDMLITGKPHLVVYKFLDRCAI